MNSVLSSILAGRLNFFLHCRQNEVIDVCKCIYSNGLTYLNLYRLGDVTGGGQNGQAVCKRLNLYVCDGGSGLGRISCSSFPFIIVDDFGNSEYVPVGTEYQFVYSGHYIVVGV